MPCDHLSKTGGSSQSLQLVISEFTHEFLTVHRLEHGFSASFSLMPREVVWCRRVRNNQW